jgi:hypothetical protein
MERDTINLLIGTLQLIGNRIQEFSTKIMALERVLENHPEIKAEYDHQLDKLYHDPATMINQSSSIERFEELRAQLLRD